MRSPPSVATGLFAGRYAIEREIGQGASAIVYLARDTQAGTAVALKILRPELVESRASDRFLREIKRTSALQHPSILPVLDAGDHEGQLYFALPYMEGGTLRQLLKREKHLELSRVLEIARTVAEALDYAHERGLIHRDVKPENILFTAGKACLGDFGIARAIDLSGSGATGTTSRNVVRGTPAYMSPEQAAGSQELDGRSDVFSLACVIYEMITGMQAYIGPTDEAVIAMRFIHPPRNLRVYRPMAPPGVDAALQKSFAILPADRYRTACELVVAVTSALTDAKGREESGSLRIKRRVRSLWVLGSAAAVAGAVAFAQLSGTSLEQDDWLLVADFSAPANDPSLGTAMRDLVTQSLKQSRFVQVYDRRQLSEVMRRANIPETTFVDYDIARELAQRGSVRAVLSGSVRPIAADNVEIVLHVVAAADASSLVSVVGITTLTALSDSIDVLVRAIRTRLGERVTDIRANRPLRDVTTPSFDAFRKYSEALDAIALRNDHAESNRLIRAAIALDSGFAAAWAVMGANYLSGRQLDSARLAYGRALSFPHRLSPAEQYRLRGDAAYAFDHDLKATIKWYDLYLVENPSSRSGRANRAVYRSALGEWQEAVNDLRDAAKLNPFGAQLNQPTLFNLAAALVVVGQLDEARAIHDSLSGAGAGYIALILAQSESRWHDAERIAVRELRDPGVTGFYRVHAMTSLASALAAQGASFAAESLLLAASRSTRGSTARWYDRARLLLVLSNGHKSPRHGVARSDSSTAADMLRALWASSTGDTSRARSLLSLIGGLSGREAAVVGHGPGLVNAWIAGSGGNWRMVVDLLGSPAKDGEMDPTIFDRPDSYHLRFAVAKAYDAMSMSDSALVYYELMLRPTLLPPGHFPLRGLVYGNALGHIADLAMQRNDRARASQALESLIASMTRVDDVSLERLAVAKRLRLQLSTDH